VTVRVQIPPVLRNMTGKRVLEAEGTTLAALLADLGQNYPALALHLFNENGTVRRNIVCVHDANVVRPKDFATHAIGDDDEVILANALAGG
jgi:sulfur-carrier protein